jgi:hypothetical protein
LKLKQLMLLEAPQQVLLEPSVDHPKLRQSQRCICHIKSISVAFCGFLPKL